MRRRTFLAGAAGGAALLAGCQAEPIESGGTGTEASTGGANGTTGTNGTTVGQSGGNRTLRVAM
jgi:hypothetical protein